jgi:hypothetical protein
MLVILIYVDWCIGILIHMHGMQAKVDNLHHPPALIGCKLRSTIWTICVDDAIASIVHMQWMRAEINGLNIYALDWCCSIHHPSSTCHGCKLRSALWTSMWIWCSSIHCPHAMDASWDWQHEHLCTRLMWSYPSSTCNGCKLRSASMHWIDGATSIIHMP